MKKKTTTKKASTFRFTATCKRLLKHWSEHLGISQTAVVEQAVREFDDRRKTKPE